MLKQLIDIQQHRERRLRRSLTSLNRDANSILAEKERLKSVCQELNRQRDDLSGRCGLMTRADVSYIQEQLIRNDVEYSRIITTLGQLSDRYQSIQNSIGQISQSIKDNLKKQEKMSLLNSALTEDNNR